MRAYYELQARISPGWTLPSPRSLQLDGNTFSGRTTDTVPRSASWLSPPHEAFANVRIADTKAVRSFLLTYGPLIADVSEIPEEGDSFETNLTLLGYMQDQVRRAWRSGKVEDVRPRGRDTNVELFSGDFITRNGELRIASLWTYTRLLLARDIASGRARICDNRKSATCSKRYFIAKRGDAKNCSRRCAIAVSVRRHREKKERRTK
jgi:hypothetical protein